MRLNCYHAGKIRNVFVFVGDVPKSVRNELDKIESGKMPNTKTLKSYFGAGYVHLLGLDLNTESKKAAKKGGLAGTGDSGASIFQSDLEYMLELTNTEPDITNEQSGGDEITLDDIQDLFNEKPEVKEKKSKLENSVTFVDFSIYPEDKISELKNKIYEATGILPFKQHLFANSDPETGTTGATGTTGGLGGSAPLGYRFYIDNIETKIDSLKIYSQKDHIDTVPIDTEIYANQEYVRVDAMDNFEIVFNVLKTTNEINLINMDEFLIPTKLDSYKKQQIIYYGFLIIYFPMLTTPEDYFSGELQIKYPDLFPDTRYIRKEQELMSDIEMIDKKDWKAIQSKINISVVYSVVKVMTRSDIFKKIVNIRNLFDRLELNEHMKYALCQISEDGKTYVVEKMYKHQKSVPKLFVFRSYILIKYYPEPDKLQHLRIIIYENGNYEIRTAWRESDNHQIHSIIKLGMEEVNKVIDLVNSMKVSSTPLDRVAEYNSVLSEIDVVVNYNERVSPSGFDNIKKQLNLFQAAGWIKPKQDFEYYILKGAFQHNINRLFRFYTLTNTYEYLTDPVIKSKFAQLYEASHNLRISQRVNDVHCEISGIKTEESKFIFKYVTYLFYLFDQVRDKKIVTADYNIRGLKEQDPALYNFKKMYDSTDAVYSKICQKPFQPVIYSQPEYDRLNKSQKDRVVKYWNFTKNTPALYGCPDPKYPFIRFIVKKHPKGYCIPCCKKNRQPENAITKACLTEHVYSAEIKNVIVSSRYITSYGKFLDIGRLSKLPETTMDVIFHGIYSTDKRSGDSACAKSEGYYLYGVPQTLQNIGNIGILHCLADAMNMKIQDIIGKLIELLDDDFHYEFDNDTVRDILKQFDTDAELPEIDFNDLIMALSRQYFNLNFVVFEDAGNVVLKLPKYMKTYKSFIPSEFRNIIVLKKLEKYYPVYLINEEIYFRTGLIESKTFTLNDQALRTIQQLVKKYIEEFRIDNNANSLKNISRFIEHSKEYRLVSAITSNTGMCFGLEIGIGTGSKAKSFYVPVDYILYNKDDMSVPGRKFTLFGSLEDTLRFVQTYNVWLSKNNIAIISVSEFLSHKGRVTGFRDNSWNYYTLPIQKSGPEFKKVAAIVKSMSYEDIPEVNLLYDIPTLLSVLDSKSVEPKAEKNVARAYYRVMLYPLVLNRVNNWLSKQRNTTIRNRIKVHLININAKMSAETLGISDADFANIKQLITDFYKHKNRKLLLEYFDREQFEFDRTWISKFLESENQKSMINELMDKIAVKTTKQPERKYNIYDGTGDYTAGQKIYISPDKWDTIRDLLIQDFNNPVKRNVLDKYMSTTVNYFNFTRRPNEKIHVLM